MTCMMAGPSMSMPRSSAFIWIVALPAISDTTNRVPLPTDSGVDVLVGVLGAGDRAHVQTGLVGERRRPDVRRLRVDRPVERLGDAVRHHGEPLHASLRQAHVVLLELQVGDDRREVGVAGALTEPVQRALDVAGAAPHRRHRVGDGAARVVVAVDADRDVAADVGVHRCRRSPRSRAAASRRWCRRARRAWRPCTTAASSARNENSGLSLNPSKKCSMSTSTCRPWPLRNSTESAIIAAPSSSVVLSASVTW